jgi:hypothetical protein
MIAKKSSRNKISTDHSIGSRNDGFFRNRDIFSHFFAKIAIHQPNLFWIHK